MIRSRNLMLFAVGVLLAIGVIMVYSASYLSSERSGRIADGFHYLRRQGLWVGLGLLALAVTMHVDYRFWFRLRWPLLVVTVGLLGAVLAFGVGDVQHGARRWLRLGPIGFQPSELAKLTAILFFSAYAAADPERLRSFFKGFLPALLILGALCGLTVLEPDLGTTAFLAVVSVALLVAGGARVWHFAPVALLATPVAAYVAYHKFGHARDRIFAFLHPEADPLGKGHQILQALIALGAGGDTGVGLGLSRQKLFFLPERHTDFIFAVLGEEIGLAGTLTVLALFLTLLVAGRAIWRSAPDRFGFLLSFGVLFAIGLQAAFNVAVVTACVPTKGISLPFVSYGGSNLILSLAAVGIVANVATRASFEEEEEAEPSPEAEPEAAEPLPDGGGAPAFEPLLPAYRPARSEVA
ncbi:MAG: putative lipid II flippase FtsW [Planctomycetes bacterium]|nr:putative lipid II flippase FtsW [Planctomycetota bacterium]